MAIVAITAIGAPLHFDFYALLCGVIYVLFIPSCFIFLPIYSIANLNDCSWGTRQEKTTTGPSKSFCQRLCGKSEEESDSTFEGSNCTCFLCLDSKYELRLHENGTGKKPEPAKVLRRQSTVNILGPPGWSNSITINETSIMNTTMATKARQRAETGKTQLDAQNNSQKY